MVAPPAVNTTRSFGTGTPLDVRVALGLRYRVSPGTIVAIAGWASSAVGTGTGGLKPGQICTMLSVPAVVPSPYRVPSCETYRHPSGPTWLRSPRKPPV